MWQHEIWTEIAQIKTNNTFYKIDRGHAFVVQGIAAD
jgi:hypothetical protein